MSVYSPPLSDAVSERIKHMVTWQIVAELMRRHKVDRDLRVYEMHPGGGQGDTLGLYDSFPDGKGSLNDFRGFRRMGEDHFGGPPLEEMGGYVWPWLTAEDPKDVVDAVERACQLEPKRGYLPPSTPTVRVFRIMAQVLAIACANRRNLQWRSALLDSSGMMGGGLRPTFKELSHISSLLPADGDLMRFNRFWMLVPGPNPDWWQTGPILAVADLAGDLYVGKRCETRLDAVTLCREQGGVPGAAASLVAMLGPEVAQ